MYIMSDACTLKYFHDKDGKIHQICLVSFSNGKLKNPRKISFASYMNDGECSVGFTFKKKRKILIAETKRLQYKGTNFGQNLSSEQHSNTYIGCFKRKQGKMKIYPADFFHCTPIMETIEQNEKESEQTDFLNKVDSLTNAFGSKGKQRAMKSRIRYKIDDSIKQDSLNTTLEESFIQIKELETVNKESSTADMLFDILPPRNVNADGEENVYNLYDVISEQEYEDIEPQAIILKDATVENVITWEKDQIYTKFIIYALKNNIGKLSLHKAKLLAYYNYMVKFSKLRYVELRRKDIAPGIPNPFKEILAKNFLDIKTINGKQNKSFPPKLKDKLLAYSFILVLFIEEFTIELSLFLSDYNVSVTKMTTIAQAIGCNVLTRKIDNIQKKVAVLKLPLFIPKTKAFVRGKRKNLD